MFDFFRNPFKKESEAPRKSAQKELKDQKEVKPNKSGSDSDAKSEVKHEKIKKVETSPKGDKETDLGAGYGIILKPHVSEKTAHSGTFDTYVFVVSRNSNKIQIKKAFWKMYGIDPIGVQIVNVHRRATQFKRISGMQSAWKKAYIRVPKGSNIEVYEGV